MEETMLEKDSCKFIGKNARDVSCGEETRSQRRKSRLLIGLRIRWRREGVGRSTGRRWVWERGIRNAAEIVYSEGFYGLYTCPFVIRESARFPHMRGGFEEEPFRLAQQKRFYPEGNSSRLLWSSLKCNVIYYSAQWKRGRCSG
jgi:hypothetical protein